MIKKIRFALSLELIAFYFAAPYIILLALDEQRGLFDATFSQTERLWCYALLVGFYPLLQSIAAPIVGRRLDANCSKVSVLRNIHLANSACYCLLAIASYKKNFLIALCGLTIPGIVGCAAPVGKTLIASLTPHESRTKEFATLAFIKGFVKLTAPLLGLFASTFILKETSYTPLFFISAFLSFCSFLYSFSLKKIVFPGQPEPNYQCPTFAFFGKIVRKNIPLLFAFVFLLTGYLVFVKYIPFIVFEKLTENPSLINYFSSVVGLAYCFNQFVVARYTKTIESKLSLLFVLLCASCITFSLSSIGVLWFVWIFITLFSFSALTTCIESKLSLQGSSGSQGAVQGAIYSIENWCFLLAPFIGSLLATLGMHYPLYFAVAATVISTLLFVQSAKSHAATTLQ